MAQMDTEMKKKLDQVNEPLKDMDIVYLKKKFPNIYTLKLSEDQRNQIISTLF